MHMILDICTKEEENEEDMPVCGESASLSPCMDIYHDQTPSKDTETQVMDSCSENNFHFIDQAARIKNEPETNTETGTTCQIQQNITKQDLDDSGASDASSDVNKVKVSHGGSPSHETQTFILPLRNQEMLTQHRMELAQIRERMSLKIQPCDSECKSKKSQPSVCQDEVSKSDKQKPDNARYSQAWRDRLKKDPVKFAEFKAFEAARAREYRRKRTATAVEIDKDNNQRLTLAAQEIFKAVEDIFSEYNEEICRSRQEIELLKRRLQQAGVQLDSATRFQGFSYIASTTRPGWINKISLIHRAKLADEEQKKAAAKARSLKHKQKVYRNPELREAYRKKERESKSQSQQERNKRNKSENEEIRRVKKIKHFEEVTLDKEQQTQSKTNLADICLEDVQHEEELSESYPTHHDVHGNPHEMLPEFLKALPMVHFPQQD
ncbi:hypothetical protein cypCar_00007329 [Cyprinus carpio]|nr:hypothetical protein cypCar_00007329 [Cyprinus carpio]